MKNVWENIYYHNYCYTDVNHMYVYGRCSHSLTWTLLTEASKLNTITQDKHMCERKVR